MRLNHQGITMGRLTGGCRLILAAGVTGAGILALEPALVIPGQGLAYAQEQAPTRREFHVSARKYDFTTARLEIVQDDLVKVTLQSPADDIPHSFTIDGYRIAKRVAAGQTVTFEFRADQAGTFPIYCNLKQDDKCRGMRGTLVVKGR
jgi:heme/copper-type cytochrome/quinol oxidase subunit 2